MKKKRLLRDAALYFVLSLFAAMVLAACVQPVQPLVQGTTIPPVTPAGEPPALPVVFGDSEMCSSLFDLNLEHTSEALQSHTFWTWHINFNAPPAQMSGADFYGCLHFFWRADNAPDVVFEPAAVYILTPCIAVGSMVAVPEPNLQSSNGFPRSGNRVDFADGSYIACSLDLGAAAEAYLAEQPLQDELDPLASSLGLDPQQVFDAIQTELLDLGGAQTYTTFSMASATGEFVPEQEGEPLPEQSIILYQPNCVGIAGCPQPVALGYTPYSSIAGDGVLPQGELLGTPYTVNADDGCPFANAPCLIELPAQPNQFDFMLYTVMEYGEAFDPQSSSDPCVEEGINSFDQYLTFRYRYAGNFAPAPANDDWQRWCSFDIVPEILSPTSPPGLQNGIPFWTGDSTILIGSNPFLDVPFSGGAFEAWIDPNSSTVTPD